MTPPGAFALGTLLLLNGQTLAVYKQPVPQKNYHLMLVLYPNHQVKTQGIALEGYQVEEIGCLPQPMIDRLQQEMRWEHDLIVFHCYTYEDSQKLPECTAPPSGPAISPQRPTPVPTPPAPTPAATEDAPAYASPAHDHTMRRGQWLKVRFGDKSWFSVYWGKDDQGTVVAHKTNKIWSLMHLDLERFGTDLEVDPNPDPKVVAEIEASITEQKAQQQG